MSAVPMTANYVRKYLLKVLAMLAVQSGHAEDSVAALAHAEGVSQFIAHARCGQGVNGLHEVAQSKNGDPAVELALLIAQADHHVGPAEVWVHHFFKALKQSCVVVQGLNARNEFCLHAVLSELEGIDFAYALKYAAKLDKSQFLLVEAV